MGNKNIHKNIEALEQKFRSIAPRLPVIAGNEVVNFALDNFKRQGFLGETFKPWPKRKNPTKWGITPPRNSRALLIDTGTLRRETYLQTATWEQVVVANSVPYAKAHNEGVRLGEIQQVKEYKRKTTTIGVVKTTSLKKRTNIQFGRKQSGETTVKAHTRRINQNIPARTFLADSPYLRNNIAKALALEITKAFNQ